MCPEPRAFPYEIRSAREKHDQSGQCPYDPRSPQYNPNLTGGGSVGYNQQFAYDPRQYNPSLTGGGSIGYNQQFAYDPRQYSPSLTGGGSPGYNSMLMQFAYDPDYVQYKLKKAFEENWIPASTK